MTLAEPTTAPDVDADEPHAFIPSGQFLTASDGRRFELCERCYASKRYTPHQIARRRAAGLDERDPRTIRNAGTDHAGTVEPGVGYPPPTPGSAHKRSETIERYEAAHPILAAPVVPATRSARLDEKPPPPWQLRMLAIALDEALGADIAFPTRILALDLQRAVKSELRSTKPAPVFVDEPAPARRDPVTESAPLRHTGSSADGQRSIGRAIKSDKLRKLAQTAIAAGWRGRINGAGNVVLASPDGAGRVTFGAADVSKSGYFSTRNALRRAGLDVS